MLSDIITVFLLLVCLLINILGWLLSIALILLIVYVVDIFKSNNVLITKLSVSIFFISLLSMFFIVTDKIIYIIKNILYIIL